MAKPKDPDDPQRLLKKLQISCQNLKALEAASKSPDVPEKVRKELAELAKRQKAIVQGRLRAAPAKSRAH
jgi:hypothetical protein